MSIWPDWLPEFWRGFLDGWGILVGLIMAYEYFVGKERDGKRVP